MRGCGGPRAPAPPAAPSHSGCWCMCSRGSYAYVAILSRPPANLSHAVRGHAPHRRDREGAAGRDRSRTQAARRAPHRAHQDATERHRVEYSSTNGHFLFKIEMEFSAGVKRARRTPPRTGAWTAAPPRTAATAPPSRPPPASARRRTSARRRSPLCRIGRRSAGRKSRSRS